jgi:hypothetical protein
VVAVSVLEVEAKADAQKIQNEAAAQQAVKQAKLELEARTAAAQQEIAKSKSDYEARVAAANQNKVVKQFGTDFWRKREAEKAKAQDKKAQEAGKAEATGVTPIKEQFKSGDAFDGPQSSPSIQVSQDAATGQPSPGGGNLGANVRAAMAGVPPGLVTTTRDTSWEPHTASGFMRPMPVDRLRRTVAPTGLTQYQAGDLANTTARTAIYEKQAQAVQQSAMKEELIGYAKYFGNAKDALYATKTRPRDWTEEFLSKAVDIARDSGREIADEKAWQRTLDLDRSERNWTKILRPGVEQKIESRMIKGVDDINLGELFGLMPLKTAEQQETSRVHLANGISYIAEVVGKSGGDFNVVVPENLMARVGEPASRQNKVVVSDGKKRGFWDTVKIGLNPASALAHRSGFALAESANIFGLIDDMGSKERTPEERRRAKEGLIELKVISRADPNTGEPMAVTEGPFSHTSQAIIAAYVRLRGLQAQFPELQLSDIQRDIYARRQEQQMENIPIQALDSSIVEQEVSKRMQKFFPQAQ